MKRFKRGQPPLGAEEKIHLSSTGDVSSGHGKKSEIMVKMVVKDCEDKSET